MADNQQYWPLAPKQTTAEDIRKVVANWPKALWQGSTIATSDELAKKKEEAKAKNRKVNITTPTQKISTTGGKTTTAVTTPKQSGTAVRTTNNTQQWTNKFASLIQGQVSGDLFKNPAMQPIDNVKVVKQDNEATHNVASNKNDESFMNTFWRAKELKKPVDVDNALMDLYSDVRTKVENWTLASSDVTKMKQVYPEFANMWDDVLLSMIWDMASLASKNMPFNDVNMNKLKSLYPELNAASWWFDKGANENMYQAWWLREQLSATSKTDLNKKWGLGIATEAVMNPVWEVATLLDMWIQMIPQADNDNTAENNLKKALSNLTEEDINKYYQQYQNYIKEHWTLSKLYTTQLEWDNTVEKLWNWISGNSKQNADAWFRSWLIDRVNNDINWWAGQIVWAWDDLKDITWPNTAKMYANMPASALKTASAVTRAITNPIDTAAWLYQLFWTEEGRQALAMRYGSWEWFAKALEQDPVWVASDWLAIVEWWAGITKLGASWLSKAWLVAALSTETLWAARTTENLLKLASRLEKLASKAWAVEKTAWLASNLWVDVPIKWVINWLRQWWENGSSVMQKLAKYSANRAETWVGKILSDAKDVVKNWPINSLADMLMWTATENDKLMKAASPAINKLTNNVDYKNKRKKLDIAENAVVEAWYTPKTIAEWAKAHTETLNKKWNEFKQMVKDKSDYEIDVKEILTEVKDYIKREKEGATAAQKADLRKLEVEVQDLERRWKVDMWFIENRKEHYNSSWRDSDKLKVWDVYLKGIKLIWNAMRKQQDNILGKWPEQTKKLRQEISALMDTKEDILKADLRNQKKKSDIAWGGLVESYWRLSWLWDIVGWILSTPVKWGEWLAQAWKWLGKLVFGKAMWKARDVDYLTKKGFEWLSKKKGLWAQKEGWLRSKFQDSRELWDLLVERDKLKKELKDEKLSKEEKEKKQKRYDDVEYAIAQKRARSWLWDKENKLTDESKKKVIDMVQKRAKDVWYVTEVVDWMEKDTQGYTDLRKKLIALEKNPWDTTAQHELFHAFFSVVDDKTKTYILDEAKKILKDSWMKDVSAEEWLAESFGIYAKRQQIKLWLIDAPKWFVAKVRDFFQRVYEYMQRFNWDRDTINKVFDEVLGEKQMKDWIMDLSELIWDKKLDRKLLKEIKLWNKNWLRNKAVYHGSPADFDKFDSSHMGEGEWAQAHGWGHYVAVDEKTWRHYAWMRGTWEWSYKWKNRTSIRDMAWLQTPEENIALSMMARMEEYRMPFEKSKNDMIKDREWYVKKLENLIEKNDVSRYWTIDEIKKHIKETKDEIDILNKIDEKDFSKTKRNLYTLDIPDPVKADTPTWKNYIEEDEKIWKSALNKMVDWFKKDWWEVEDSYGNVNVSKWWVEFWLWDWTDTWKYIIQNEISNPKAFSQALNKMWYDWIHYFWWRDWEAYVIFNDDALKIKDHIRYKKKTDSEWRDLSDRQLKYFGNSKVRNDKWELVPVYHFTADNFNTVDFKKGAQNYFWFTSDKNASDRAMWVRPWMEKKRKDMYVDIKNPAWWDEYNKFWTDELKARGYDWVILKEKDWSFEGFIWDKENQVKYVDNQNPTRASKDMRFKKWLEEKKLDDEYKKAVESWDTEKALWMLRKAAAEKGYNKPEDYKWAWAWRAPSSDVDRKDFRNLDKLKESVENWWDTNVYALAQWVSMQPDDYFSAQWPRWYMYDDKTWMQSYYAIKKAMDSINKQIEMYWEVRRMPEIQVYRAVPKDLKEWMLQSGWEWVSPSIDYVKEHWMNRFDGNYKILKEIIPADELWWDGNDMREWGFDDGKEYVTKWVKNSRKNIEVTYDRRLYKPKYDENGNKISWWEVWEEKLIPLSKRFNEKKSDVRYKKDIPEDKKLIWLHNLGIDKLRWVIELWGMPMPSIAVTKKWVPHESYWDITFIMKESAINPALSRKNRLYTVDWYTPTVPQPTIKVKDTKEANLLMDKIQKETGIWYWELMQWLEYHDDRYFKDYPKLKEFEKYYDQLTEKKLFDWFTYTGKRRYKDYNLDNIVKSMVGNKRDAFNGAFWKMVAQSQWNATVDKLRERKYWLKDKDLAEKMWEKYYDALRELASKKWIEQKIESLSDYWRFAENVSDAYRANTDAWWRELTQWDGAEGTIYSKITKEDLEPLQKIIKEAAELPRPYSEAKPERAIRFNEVWAVVAPEGKLKEVKDMLKDTWLKVYWYKEGERMSVVDRVADDNGLRFKKKVDQTQTPEFKKWFEGSKVVDKSWKPMVVYHWTHNDFNTFDRSKVWLKTKNKWFFGEWFYFTTSEKLADSYADSWWDTKEWKKGKVMAVYLDVKKPFMWNDYKWPEAIEKLRKELWLSEDVLKWNNYWDNWIKEFWFMDEDNAVKFREALQKKGYDWVWLKRENWNNEIVAFEPNQIKSATDNIWTFDKNNPDIRYKRNKWLEFKSRYYRDRNDSFRNNIEMSYPKVEVTISNNMIEKIRKNVNENWDKISKKVIEKINNAINNRKHVSFPYAVVDSETAWLLKSQWATMIPEAHAITSDWVIHLLRNHWENWLELEPWDIPITIDDIRMIPSIVKNPDRKYPWWKTKARWFQTIVYEKTLWWKVFYIESHNTDRNLLEPQSMRKHWTI